MKKKSFGNADLAGAWSMHIREGDKTKFFDQAKTTKGKGKVFSLNGRPTLLSTNFEIVNAISLASGSFIILAPLPSVYPFVQKTVFNGSSLSSEYCFKG